jgi:hypothetical protein
MKFHNFKFKFKMDPIKIKSVDAMYKHLIKLVSNLKNPAGL